METVPNGNPCVTIMSIMHPEGNEGEVEGHFETLTNIIIDILKH